MAAKFTEAEIRMRMRIALRIHAYLFMKPFSTELSIAIAQLFAICIWSEFFVGRFKWKLYIWIRFHHNCLPVYGEQSAIKPFKKCRTFGKCHDFKKITPRIQAHPLNFNEMRQKHAHKTLNRIIVRSISLTIDKLWKDICSRVIKIFGALSHCIDFI